MRIAVLGAGAMGSAAARLLARSDDVDLAILDVEADRAERVADECRSGAAASVTSGAVDISGGSLSDALRGCSAVAACIPYRLNLAVMEAALLAGCGYADLGGLFHTTLQQWELHERFAAAGVPAVLGIGSAPGITNVLARAGADRLDPGSVRSIDCLDGAVDAGGEFGVPYSAATVIDEFTLPAMVFEDGRMTEVPAASGEIRHTFPEPVGEQEAFYTLHSEPATLPRTIDGVRDVRWRLALPDALARGFRLLVSLGLAGEEPIHTSAGPAVPRDVLMAVLSRLPEPEGPPADVEIVEVLVEGTKDGRPARFTGTVTLRPSLEGLSAGAFGTALPIVVAARWMAEGRVPPGVHPPENAVGADAFLEALAAEGIEVRLAVEERLGP
jgi:saccharopine dehydrogenase-like NADP-dependent oxidoreductase